MSNHDAGQPLDEKVLDVYASRDGGWWNPDHGDLATPTGTAAVR